MHTIDPRGAARTPYAGTGQLDAAACSTSHPHDSGVPAQRSTLAHSLATAREALAAEHVPPAVHTHVQSVLVLAMLHKQQQAAQSKGAVLADRPVDQQVAVPASLPVDSASGLVRHWHANPMPTPQWPITAWQRAISSLGKGLQRLSYGPGLALATAAFAVVIGLGVVLPDAPAPAGRAGAGMEAVMLAASAVGQGQEALLPLVAEHRLAQAGAAWLVRADVSNASLAALGAPFDPSRATQAVATELLVDARGEVLAVRYLP